MEEIIKTIIIQHGPEILRNGAELADAFAESAAQREDIQLFCDFVDIRGNITLLDAKDLPLSRQVKCYEETVSKLANAVNISERMAHRVCGAFWRGAHNSPVPSDLQQALRQQQRDKRTQAVSRVQNKLRGVKILPLLLAAAIFGAFLLPVLLPSFGISNGIAEEELNAHPHGIPVVWKDSWRVYREGELTLENGKYVRQKGEYVTQRDGYICYEDGKIVTQEWREWDGRKYCFGKYGEMCTGLCYADGEYYGFHKDTGELLTGEVPDEWLTHAPSEDWDVTLFFDENGVYQYTKYIYYQRKDFPDNFQYTWDDVKSFKKDGQYGLELGCYLPGSTDCTYLSVEASNILLTKGKPDGKWQLYLYYYPDTSSDNPEGQWVCYDAVYHSETGTVTAEAMPNYQWYYGRDNQLNYISRYLLVYDDIAYGAECSFDVIFTKLVREDEDYGMDVDYVTWYGRL